MMVVLLHPELHFHVASVIRLEGLVGDDVFSHPLCTRELCVQMHSRVVIELEERVTADLQPQLLVACEG